MGKQIVLTAFLFSVAAFGQAPAHISIAGRDVALWRPAGPPPTPSGFPVIVFSHGFSGCHTQSVFLMQALASEGYFVLAPNHRDARCGTARQSQWSARDWRPEEPFQKPSAWTDATYRDRADDIRAVLDAVLRAPSFEGVRVDPKRVGVAGHSLGGYTVLGLAGAWPSWKDDRIRVVLALSPYTNPYLGIGDLGGMDVPVMYQGGTVDLGITPSVKRVNGAYDRSSAPKYFVEFKGAGHFAWTDLNARYQKVIGQYSVAFFDQYLKGRDSLTSLTETPWPAEVKIVRESVK
ncbi:MAG TPA: alpha/beta fold hydrolase [Bryobacteraceae bacterium]|nr:alpha/beta fold hydrolase [Bryobacteraceae bacterium]